MRIQDVDFSLYVIADPQATNGRMLQDVVRKALDGGATVIHYRDKSSSLRNQLDLGRQIRDLTNERGATFIVNDRPDMAIVLEADGVNVGPEDMPVEMVRRVVGKDILIGASIATREEATEAEASGADFLIARPVFRPRWQTDGRPTMGDKGLAEIVRLVSMPVIGVGGINMDNLSMIYQAGAAGAGIVSAVLGAQEPNEAVAQLHEMLSSYRQRT